MDIPNARLNYLGWLGELEIKLVRSKKLPSSPLDFELIQTFFNEGCIQLASIMSPEDLKIKGGTS